MSICRPARCLFTKAAATTLPRPAPQRSFQTSASRQGRRRRPHYPSIKADDLKLLNEAAEAEYPKYDTSETSLLAKQYTPSQIAAIKAAESAIDTRDVLIQGQQRTDPWLIPYEDDLAEVDPVTDKRARLSPDSIPGTKSVRLANDVERDAAMSRIANENLAKMYPDGIPEGTLDPAQEQRLQDSLEAALTQAALDPRATYTSDNPAALEALADPRHSAVMPDLPRLNNRMARQTRRLSTEEEEDPRQKRLLQYLGWDKQKLRSIRVKTLVSHSVTNQTRMGKIRSLYYLTIAGNQDGLLGVGEGKSVEPEEGRKQSVMSAIRNMRPVPRYENRTTFGDLEKKVGATKVQLFARPPGFGLRTQHLIFELARAAGLQDLAAKTPRSRNKMNVIKATWEALTSQKLPDEIARARGKKLVDVRKVYYGGSVH
ncbi:ribosomal protein S5, C-terminal domain-containing protein [Paraphoma chrysanthemicola]|nr:ribosomal protein S5, C-terminal domain-containing protein [Paraphoma chrysanthemicola]